MTSWWTCTLAKAGLPRLPPVSLLVQIWIRTDACGVCPEHEHWQLRTGQNVLTSCTQFLRDEEVLLVGEPDEESVARRLPFGERDENVHLRTATLEPKMKRRREA